MKEAARSWDLYRSLILRPLANVAAEPRYGALLLLNALYATLTFGK
jgi:hypothetical protein